MKRKHKLPKPKFCKHDYKQADTSKLFIICKKCNNKIGLFLAC